MNFRERAEIKFLCPREKLQPYFVEMLEVIYFKYKVSKRWSTPNKAGLSRCQACKCEVGVDR
jgi:hypothetical protein